MNYILLSLEESKQINVLHLYRNTLRKAKKYPSVNKNVIIKEIKRAYRKDKHITDEEKIRQRIQEGLNGLDHLDKYSSIDLSKTNIHLKV